MAQRRITPKQTNLLSSTSPVAESFHPNENYFPEHIRRTMIKETPLIERPLYYEIIRNIPIACVDVAIVYRDHILLVKRTQRPAEGRWWLPGGRVLKGEKMSATALRKAKEEVGLDCILGPLVHTAETIFPDGPDGISVHSINSCFLLEAKNMNVDPDNTVSDWKWTSKIPPKCHIYVKKCMEKAFEEL